MAKSNTYYMGDVLSKIGCGLMGGAATQIHIIGSMKTMPTGALILAGCCVIFGVYIMKKYDK